MPDAAKRLIRPTMSYPVGLISVAPSGTFTRIKIHYFTCPILREQTTPHIAMKC